jgi:hypothetical protein
VNLFARVAALDAFGVLAFAGVSHALNVDRLRRDIEQQGLIPALGPLHLWVANGLVAIEVVSAVIGCWAIIAAPEFLRPVALLVSGLYFGFAAYAVILLRRRPNAPCGCAAESEPVNVWTVVRATLLGLLTVVAAMGAEHVALAGRWTELAVALLAAVALGVTLWCLPTLLGGTLVVHGRSGSLPGSPRYTEAA